MTSSDDLPKWAKDSQEQLKDMKPKIQAIKKQGQAEIRRGIEKVKEANKLQGETDYLGRVLAQHHEPLKWTDAVITGTGVRLASSILSLNQSIDRMATIVNENGDLGEAQLVKFNFAIPSTDNSGGSAIYLGASIESRFKAIEPTYKAVLAESEPARLTSHDALFHELRSTVEVFGKEFVVMLDGSEVALGTGTPDSLQQAAHSMRDCFQQLIEYLALTKVVKSQPWFEPTKGTPEGISRRSRLRYLLYGSGENVDESIIKQQDELADIAKESLDFCMARAHDHDSTLTRDEVGYAVDLARNALLNVLKSYNSFRGK